MSARWSSSMPTTLGPYWVRTTTSSPNYAPTIMRVIDANPTRILVETFGNEGESYLSADDVRSWLWQGPITPELVCPTCGADGACTCHPGDW